MTVSPFNQMKFTVLLSAALIAGGFSTLATTQSVVTGTNANPEAVMTALFGDPTLVKASGFQIKRSELDQVVSREKANYTAANQQVPNDLEIMNLEKLIAIRLLTQTTNAADAAAGQQRADANFTNLVKTFPSSDAFNERLKLAGTTVGQLRAELLQSAELEAALKRALNVNPTEQDAQDYYNKHPAYSEQPEKVHVRHILLLTIDPATRPLAPLTTNTIAAKHRQIEELRKRILAGEDFAALAKQYSEDPGSKENGGELPEFSRADPRNPMAPEFESAAFALTNNQVSEVVSTVYGFHLIKLLERIPAKKFDFAAKDQEIKDGLAQLQISKLVPAYLKKLRAEQQVEIEDADLKNQDQQIQVNQAAAAAAAADAASSTN